MYTRFFGLTAEPFSLSPDPSFFFLSDGHANALAALKIGIRGQRGLMVMTGEVGTGKTTLLYSLLGDIGPRFHTAYLSNTKLRFDEMLQLALTDFGIPCPSRERADMLAALNRFLRRCAEEKRIAALVVDEAQNLDEDTFEHIRLLSNFETLTAKLLQIILVGQPELELKLRQPSLRQVAERVAVRCHLKPLSRTESEGYLDHRLRRVDAHPDLFTAGARRVILGAAQGIPRRINILCDNALLFAFGRERTQVSRTEARLAVRERGALLAPPSLLRRAWRMLIAPDWDGLRVARLVAVVALLVAVAAGAIHWYENRSALGSRAATTSTAAPLSDRSERPVGSVSEGAIEPPAARAESLPTSPLAARDFAPGPRQAAADRAPGLPATAGDSAAAGQLVKASPAEQTTAVGAVASVDREADPHVPPPSAQSERSDPRDDSASPPQSRLAIVRSRDIADDSTPPRTEDDSATFRTVRVTAGSTLSSLTREVYGLVDPGLIAQIQSANPHVVDPDRIRAGDTLRFPEVDQRTGRPVKDHQ